ncbi:MAG: DUF6263 family protein [Candidatus Pedobacter colombiensis]|uniref:DUF6263 family protein n=1 Tax=Candidatus Pedobacter colombiensis TaxID=3121371 RepID=A0AAJ5W5I0_9SPHI|nr:DUF6263 family protein [Pedobacter sp.]WEK18471.1 MAG: DUF6263 family protein [Pedobacter sp.]
MKKTLWLFLAAVSLLTCKSESGRILIKLTKGQKYTQHMITRTSTTQTIMGKEMISSSISDMVNKYEVVNVSDSIYTFKVTYESMSTKVIKDGDSSIVAKSLMWSILNALKGKSYEVKISNAGRVIATIGTDSIFSDLIRDLPGFPATFRTAMAKQLVDSYGDKAIKQKVELGMNVYPQKSVKEGDSWTVARLGGDNVMAPQIDAVYKLDKITGSEYLISGKSKLRVGSSNSSQLSSVPIRYDLSGTMNSTNKIDKQTGLITEAKIDQDITGTLKIKEGTPALGGTTIPMHVKSEIVITNSLNK